MTYHELGYELQAFGLCISGALASASQHVDGVAVSACEGTVVLLGVAMLVQAAYGTGAQGMQVCTEPDSSSTSPAIEGHLVACVSP